MSCQGTTLQKLDFSKSFQWDHPMRLANERIFNSSAKCSERIWHEKQKWTKRFWHGLVEQKWSESNKKVDQKINPPHSRASWPSSLNAVMSNHFYLIRIAYLIVFVEENDKVIGYY